MGKKTLLILDFCNKMQAHNGTLTFTKKKGHESYKTNLGWTSQIKLIDMSNYANYKKENFEHHSFASFVNAI